MFRRSIERVPKCASPVRLPYQLQRSYPVCSHPPAVIPAKAGYIWRSEDVPRLDRDDLPSF